jgi:PAS domain S-box-containing protein
MNDFGRTKKELLQEIAELRQKKNDLEKALTGKTIKTQKPKGLRKICEEYFSMALQSIGDGIILTDTRGLIDYMNPVAEKMCGLNFAQASGKPLSEVFVIVNADTRESIPFPVKDIIENGEIVRHVVRTILISHKGEKYQIADVASQIRDEEGNCEGVAIVISDVTEKYISEKKLKESKNKYKKAFQSTSDAISISERDGMYIDINEGFTNITGYTKEDIIGKLSTEINLWAIPEDLEKLVLGLKERGFINHLESRFRCKDGSLKTAIVSANIVVLNNEPHILAIAHDITERKEMEELIIQSKKQYDDLVSNIPVGVYVLHTKPEGSFALDFVSPRTSEMLDISIENLILHSDAIYDIVHPDDREGFINLNEEGIKLRRPFNWKGRAVINGITSWLHISSKPMELENGDVLWNGLIVDVTDQVLSKAEIERQNEELRRMNAEKDKFFSIIAHDLRSPFNGFLGLTQIMAEDLPNLTMAEVQTFAVGMRKSATNLYRLLNNLLDWAKIQQGVIQYRPEAIQLSSLVAEIIDVISESARSKEIKITTHIPVGIEVFADANMLQTILRNLLSNAIKFTPKRGKIRVSVNTSNNEGVEISIQDNGIGMSYNHIENLFWHDIPTNREGTDGEPSTGLGLLLCKEFVEKHGGKLWIESQERKGSTFSFVLPNYVSVTETVG